MATENEIDIEEMEDISQVKDDQGASREVEQPEVSASSTEHDVSNTVSDDDTLSIVRDVVDKTAAPEAAASSAKSEEVGLADAQIPTAKQDNENYSDVPFNKHPRFQAVLTELKEAKKHAELSLNIENFLDESGLEREEAADGLRLMALVKTDPVKAWAELRPWVETVIRAAGEVLPDDIKAMVEQGQMTHDAAIMLSRQRAQTQSMEARQSFAERRAARQREFEATRQSQDAVATRMNAAQRWEDERREKDPNFDAKLPLIVEEVKRLQAMGWMPHNEEAVAEQLRRAYSSVNAKALRTAPAQTRRPETRPVTGGQVNGATRVAPPASTMGIIQAELAKRQAG
jgi:hypothetical protein